MRRIEKASELQDYLEWCKDHHKTIGFIPTMGALHDGHISLVNLADTENDIVIVSIFVNPAQFNNPKDLEKYPRTIYDDAKLLEKTGCNVIFAPNAEEIYPKDSVLRPIDLGKLDTTLEGLHRPGHFEGVVKVVQRLFDLVQPNKAYFGRKDFQQVAVVKTTVKILGYSVEIRVGETIREESGLAMSSRNSLLSEEDKKEAVLISSTMIKMKEWAKYLSPKECVQKGKLEFEESPLKLEYLEVIHPLTFETIEKWTLGATVCVVAYSNGVRLIDNMELISEV